MSDAGIAARLSARLLKQFGSPESVFRAPLRQLEGCELPAATAQAILKKEALKVAQSLTGSGQKIYALLSSDEPRPIDDIVETTGLNSSDVLATLFDLEMKGFVRQLPGKRFSKILL